jgi:hypothetical protein
MNKPMLPRLGAACGAVFAVVLTVANGNGNEQFAAPRVVAGIAALTLMIPFLCYLCSLLRDAETVHGWMATSALTAGISGIALKLASGAPELALYRAHIAAGTSVHKALEEIAGAATLLSLYPLALFCAATAILVFRTRALPRWLGVGAAVTAAALTINGAFLATSNVPALLLFALWTLLTSVYLVARAGRGPARARQAETAVGRAGHAGSRADLGQIAR